MDIADQEISIGIENIDDYSKTIGQGDDDMERDINAGTLNYTRTNFVGGRDKRIKQDRKEDSPNILSNTQKTISDSNYEDEGFESMSVNPISTVGAGL